MADNERVARVLWRKVSHFLHLATTAQAIGRVIIGDNDLLKLSMYNKDGTGWQNRSILTPGAEAKSFEVTSIGNLLTIQQLTESIWCVSAAGPGRCRRHRLTKSML